MRDPLRIWEEEGCLRISCWCAAWESALCSVQQTTLTLEPEQVARQDSPGQ